jgi:serine/threonine protein kinase
LDWNWNARIADFGQSISLTNPEIPSVVHPNAIDGVLLLDSYYFAPECYDNNPSHKSDVFSFGLILYELLTGQPVFSNELTLNEIAFKMVMKHKLPNIPEFVLPSGRELITDCWAEEPDDRLSFNEIVDRLKEIKFKVMPNVNSSKLSKFVKQIEGWEAHNLEIPQ